MAKDKNFIPEDVSDDDQLIIDEDLDTLEELLGEDFDKDTSFLDDIVNGNIGVLEDY